MEEIKRCNFYIEITQNNLEEKKIIQIQKDKDFYPFTFTLENNQINFFDDFIQNPIEYKLYTIQYQQKSYSIVAEVLIALILNDFVKKVKKEFIIDKTILVMPFENNFLKQRITVALEKIDLKIL